MKWHDYDVFNMPPAYKTVIMEVEISTEYGTTEKQTLRGYYDKQIGTFRDFSMRTPNYTVLRWKIAEE